MRRSMLAAALGIALLASLLPAGALLAAGHTKYDHTVVSFDGTSIVISVYKPGQATSETPVPVILHSHGWGGSRTSSATAFQRELDRGFAVVSIDQRGFGASGGKANVTDPEFEGRDVIAVVDYVATLDWVMKDLDAQERPIANDPVLFAMGGSYGGGYQFVGALTEVRSSGTTRFNAIAPEITWFNLSRSLAPEGVVRSAWSTLLYAAGASAIVEYVHPAYAYGASTGQWPDGTVSAVHNLDAEFFQHGPSGFVADGIHLDIPTLIYQGASDNLFNLNEGIHNFQQTLTPAARAQSLFVGFNGGHALPNVAPTGFASAGDACSGQGGFSALRLRFFEAVLKGDNPRALLPAAYSFTTADGQCVRTDTFTTKTLTTGFDVTVGSGTMTTTGAGAPQHLELADGPITVTGIPRVRADVGSLAADQRVFLALSVGTSAADAQVVQNNMMPLRELLPALLEERTIELPGVAVEVPAGKKLFLTVSPVSDMSFAHGSTRTPGGMLLADIRVDLPIPTVVASE